MNLNRTESKIFLLLLLLALPLSGCESPVITKGILTNWFWSRLGWAALVSLILGVGAAKFLCRLPIIAPLLDCIRAARIRFMWWSLLLVLVITPLYLWLDAWITQPFGEDMELEARMILHVVVLDWRTLAIMFVVGAVFYAAVAFFTRYVFARTCSCKYAFLPKIGN